MIFLVLGFLLHAPDMASWTVDLVVHVDSGVEACESKGQQMFCEA